MFLAVLATLAVVVCAVLSLLGFTHVAGTVALWCAAIILLIAVGGGTGASDRRR